MLILRVVKRLASLGIVLIAVAAVASTAVVASAPHAATFATSHAGTAADLELSSLAERSSMYASDGTFLTFLTEEENRQEVDLEDIPQEVIDAILTIEDADFYEHDGVNLRGTFRALVENINAGGISQGGSTITQQLVKLSLLTTDQNLSRKSTEAFYALRLERQMTKDEILERYLNSVYFGSGAYGVQAAAETYWGYDSVAELGWAESALLAGIIRNPTQYDPTRFPNAARARRSVALDRLVSTGHITPEEAETYEFAQLPAERQQPFDTKPTDYFVQQALLTLLRDDPSILGGDEQSRFNAIYRGGLKIYTTFDPVAQQAALQTRDSYIEESTGYTVAIATVDSKTGAVRAMVGGPEFERNKFNLATQGLRQPGSSMKTYVLAAAFEDGYTPNDIIRADGPCSFSDVTAENGVYRVGGRLSTPRQSLAAVTRSSNNCAFVRLGQVVGNDKVIQASQRLGISTFKEVHGEFLSLPLGPVEVIPMEMASAYAAINNDGKLNKAWYIERIEDRDGNTIYEHRPDWTRAISQQSARMITQVLESNVRSGTGQNGQLNNGHAAAGKTGTAQNHEDAWFVGYTEYYTTAVWLGDPTEKRPIIINGQRIFGGNLPTRIWGDYMNLLHENLEPIAFAEPEPYRSNRYLKVKGEIDFCEDATFEGATGATQLVDSNGDGRNDCFKPVTTTTETTTTTTSPPPTNNNGGGDGNGGNGRGRGGDDENAAPVTTIAPDARPQPTVTLARGD